MTQTIKVSIIEDNRLYTQSLQRILELSEFMEFQASYSSAEAYLEGLSKKTVVASDIILLDLHLPGKSGLQLIPILRKEMPNTDILVLTQNDDYYTTIEAIRLGVAGYLLKDSPVGSIREAIIEINQGSSIIDPQL